MISFESPLLQKVFDELNTEQKSAVELNKNAVVAAGAGSGKTRVLAYRFAYLIIARSIPVDQIITLTFTDKAASQMYQKIYEVLKEISDIQPVNDYVKRAQTAVENFHTARIQTLDSYCASIVKKGGRFFGISPDFTTDLHKAHEFAEKMAIPFVLKHRTNASLQEFIGTKKVEDIAVSLFAQTMIKHSTISSPVPFLDLFEDQKKEVLTKYKTLVSIVEQAIKTIRQNFDEIQETEKKLAAFKNLQKVITSIEEFLFPSITTIEHYFTEKNDALEKQLLLCIQKTHTYKKLTIGTKKIPFDLIQQAVLEIRENYADLSAMCNFILTVHIMKDILVLMEEFQEEFIDHKRMSGVLTFKDVSDLALHILKNNADIRETEKQGCKAIMIDEFQDNNSEQRDMLYLLAEKPIEELEEGFLPKVPKPQDLCPNKLFFVGDEKQSIYKFRGADVSVFRSLKKHFDTSVKLSINYRSHPALIASFNSLFGGSNYPQKDEDFYTPMKVNDQRSSIFIKENHLVQGEIFPNYEAEYESVNYASKKLDLKPHVEPRVHVCLVDNKKEEDYSEDEKADQDKSLLHDTPYETEEQEESLSSTECEAYFTAKKIHDLIKESDGSLTYSSFAILFRTYSKQYFYEKHLRAMGIPYISESINSFFSDAPVNDIFSLLRLILFPQDAVSYATVLHSPFVHVSQNTVNLCLSHFDQDAQPFDQTIIQELDQTEAYFYRMGADRFERISTIAKTATVTELITRIWYTEGYRYETLWNEEAGLFSELYDFLYELARLIDSEGNTLSEFIDLLDTYKTEDSRLTDMDIPLERPGAVRLMSIHKSKGLEFPIVFVCGLSNSGQTDTNNEASYFDKEFGICLNFDKHPDIPECKKNYFFTRRTTLENYMRDAELRRLLYVAMTRAEEHVFITSSIKLSKKERENLVSLDEFNNPLQTFESFIYAQYKSMINKKDEAEKGKIYLTPQFCKPSDNLYSFIMPSMTSFIVALHPQDPPKNIKPFIIEEIPQYTEKEFEKIKTKHFTDITSVQKAVFPIYMSIEEKTDETEQDFHISPSSIHNDPDNDEEFNNTDKKASANSYSLIDDLISSLKKGKFAYEDFGTMAHAYAESAFTGMQVALPARITSALTPSQLDIATKTAQEMIDLFMKTELGQKAKSALWRKNEYEFKMLIQKTNTTEYRIINGSIDLVFEDSGIFYIVDFKTDLIQDISRHTAQLALYRRALSEMKKIGLEKIRTVLHYLRTNTTTDITTETSEVDIEKLLFK